VQKAAPTGTTLLLVQCPSTGGITIQLIISIAGSSPVCFRVITSSNNETSDDAMQFDRNLRAVLVPHSPLTFCRVDKHK
jgi:hypothetical protein